MAIREKQQNIREVFTTELLNFQHATLKLNAQARFVFLGQTEEEQHRALRFSVGKVSSAALQWDLGLWFVTWGHSKGRNRMSCLVEQTDIFTCTRKGSQGREIPSRGGVGRAGSSPERILSVEPLHWWERREGLTVCTEDLIRTPELLQHKTENVFGSSKTQLA